VKGEAAGGRCLAEIGRGASFLGMVSVIQGAGQGPTRQLGGRLTVNPWSPTRRGPTRLLTLNLGGECSPVVSKPFTAIFPYPMLLLNLGLDSLANILKYYSLYAVWARGPHLPVALASKMVF